MSVMDAAVAVVIGAGIGAGATLLGSVLTARQQASQQRSVAVRERKQAAYENAIRFLLRAANRRSGLTAAGVPYIAEDQIATFFDDLVEAQHWLSVLVTACDARQRPAIEAASTKLNGEVEGFALHARGVAAAPFDLKELYRDVINAAREDLGVEAA